MIGQSEHVVGLVLAWPESPRNFLLLSVLEPMNTKSCYFVCQHQGHSSV